MVAGWLKKKVVNGVKDYVKDWIKDNPLIVGTVVLTLALILVFSAKGMFYNSCRRRRKRYHHFKSYKQTLGKRHDSKDRTDKLDDSLDDIQRADRRKRRAEERKKLKRMYKIGCCCWIFPNILSWWTIFKYKRRLKRNRPEDFKDFPRDIKSFPGDLELALGRRVLRAQVDAKIKDLEKRIKDYYPVLKAVELIESTSLEKKEKKKKEKEEMTEKNR